MRAAVVHEHGDLDRIILVEDSPDPIREAGRRMEDREVFGKIVVAPHRVDS